MLFKNIAVATAIAASLTFVGCAKKAEEAPAATQGNAPEAQVAAEEINTEAAAEEAIAANNTEATATAEAPAATTDAAPATTDAAPAATDAAPAATETPAEAPAAAQ